MVLEIIAVLIIAWVLVRGRPVEFKLTIEHKYPTPEPVDVEKMKQELSAEETKFYEESKSVIGVLNDILAGDYKENDK